jgi:glycosyltransferase involved in cell wall biosynthesis
MLAAQQAHIPYLVTFHTGGHSSRFRSSIRTMQWKALRPLFAGAAKLVGVSRFEADYFSTTLNLPRSRFTVISNGATMPELPHEMPAPSEAQPVIVSIGRLEHYKGHHRLLAAMPKVRERYPNARLLILGAGPYEAALREQVRAGDMTDYVEIRAIPSAERQTMAITLAQASLVTLLSDYEAHPIAVMEALSLGRPVLVADTSGLHELAEDNLVRAIPVNSTPQEVAAAVIHQIEEPLLPAKLSLPTWDDCARQLRDVYASLVETKASVS